VRRRVWDVLALLVIPTALAAQQGAGPAATVARADSLLAAGEPDRARDAYEEVLRRQPDDTRALFQLARLLEEGSPRAVALLRRYAELEPQDAWGHWALGEALAPAGELDAADRALSEAQRLQPGERDFVIARARVLARAGRHSAAADEYRRWLAVEPDDVEALRERAEQLRRARRPAAAAAALERLLALGADPAAEARLDGLRAELAPAIEPGLRTSRDSDGNSVDWARLRVDSHIVEGVRLGLAGAYLRSGDGLQAIDAWEGALALDWTPRPGADLNGQAGAARAPRGALAGESETIPLLRMRGRWRPLRGPTAELRLQHEPVSATPLLLGTPLVLGEARAMVDLPVLGPLRARGLARAGRLTGGEATNRRFAYGGGPMLRLGGATEAAALYQRMGYARDSDAGYFAPQAIEAVEVGAYTEHYGLWPLVLAFDAGVGAERITHWVLPRGGWERAFRFWSLVSWTVSPGRELRLEAEAYDTRAGAALTPTAEGWRWGSVGLAFRAAVR
jgi:tetratricopeptide (TPR) repeat protein